MKRWKKISNENSNQKTAGMAILTSGKTDFKSKTVTRGTSLVVQWLRIHLAMKGTWVQPLVGEPRSHVLPSN